VNEFENGRRPLEIEGFKGFRKKWSERQLASRRKKKYGVSPEHFEAMFEAQGRCCAICKTTDPGRGWHLDHDHDFNVPRGVLCAACNLGLGFFRDSSVFLMAAAEYVLRVPALVNRREPEPIRAVRAIVTDEQAGLAMTAFWEAFCRNLP